MDPPRIGKIFKFISEFRIKRCGMDPPDLTSGGNFWNSSFPCTVQWCMQICHKPSPSLEGHLKMLIYSIFYWKCRFEMAVMHMKPHKRYKCNIFISEFRMKCCGMYPPRIGKIFKFISEFRVKRCGMDPPRSDIWWKFLKFYLSMYCPMMHVNLP